MSKKDKPKWVSNAERREFARKLAARKYGGQDDSSALLWLGYAGGIEDAMLTPEDIKTINRLYGEVSLEWVYDRIQFDDEDGIFTEVLKRFNEIKFKK